VGAPSSAGAVPEKLGGQGNAKESTTQIYDDYDDATRTRTITLPNGGRRDRCNSRP